MADLTLTTVRLAVPDTWGVQRHERHVLLGGVPTPGVDFQPVVVVAESRARGDVAAAAQSTIAHLPAGVGGCWLFDVEARTVNGFPSRRLRWQSQTDDLLALLSVMDLIQIGDVIVEATATLPLDQDLIDECLGVLDSIAPLPDSERCSSGPVTDLPAARLDDSASSRAGDAREVLPAAPTMAFTGSNPAVDGAFADGVLALGNAGRLFGKKIDITSHPGSALFETGLVDASGRPVELGSAMRCMLSGGGHLHLRGRRLGQDMTADLWFRDGAVLFMAGPSVSEREAGLTHHHVEVGHVADAVRLVMSWTGSAPAWPLRLALSLTPEDLDAKVDHGRAVGPPASITDPRERADSLAFGSTPWTVWTLTNAQGDALGWVTTPDLGSAVMATEPHQVEEITLGHGSAALWELMITFVGSQFAGA